MNKRKMFLDQWFCITISFQLIWVGLYMCKIIDVEDDPLLFTLMLIIGIIISWFK